MTSRSGSLLHNDGHSHVANLKTFAGARTTAAWKFEMNRLFTNFNCFLRLRSYKILKFLSINCSKGKSRYQLAKENLELFIYKQERNVP